MDLSNSLYLWAKNCDERKETLQTWLDDAIIKCATSQGKTLASSTANGVSVTFMTNALTLEEWISALTRAIQMIKNPVVGKKKAIQIFR